MSRDESGGIEPVQHWWGWFIAGGVAGAPLGAGLGGLPWMNLYVALTLIVIGLVLCATVMTAGKAHGVR